MTKKQGKTFDIELDSDDWCGGVSMRLLPYHERIALIDQATKGLGEADSVAKAARLAPMLRDAIVKLEVTHTQSKVQFKSLEELEYSEVGSELFGHLLPVLINGAPLKNVLRLRSKKQPS